jgi:copper(I)-binding protein
MGGFILSSILFHLARGAVGFRINRDHPMEGIRMKRTVVVFLLFSLLLAACAGAAPQAASGTIEIQNAWSRPAMMNMGGHGGSTGAVYLTVVNKGAEADRLTAAESDVAESVEIHQTTIKDNIASMSPVEAVEVPARGQAELKPGGYHIMLVGLKHELKAGETVKLALVFEKAGKINVEAEVRNP